MKAISIALLTLLLSAPGLAQDARFVHDHGFRWYVAPTTQVSRINGEAAYSQGLSAGWIINDRISVGFAAHTLANTIEADRPSPRGAQHTAFFYSGITASYSQWVLPRLQMSAIGLVGGGEAHWRKNYWDDVFQRFERDDDHTTSFVAEPQIGATYVLRSWLAISGSAGYRYVTGGKSNVLEQNDMSSITGTIGVRFGRF